MSKATIELIELDAADRLYDTRNAAPRIGLKAGTLAIMRHKGEGPKYILAGTAVRYSQKHLDEWNATRTVDPTLGPTKDLHRRKGGPGRPPKKAKLTRRRALATA